MVKIIIEKMNKFRNNIAFKGGIKIIKYFIVLFIYGNLFCYLVENNYITIATAFVTMIISLEALAYNMRAY